MNKLASCHNVDSPNWLISFEPLTHTPFFTFRRTFICMSTFLIDFIVQHLQSKVLNLFFFFENQAFQNIRSMSRFFLRCNLTRPSLSMPIKYSQVSIKKIIIIRFALECILINGLQMENDKCIEHTTTERVYNVKISGLQIIY